MPAAPAAVSIRSVSATCTAIITRWTRRPCTLPITRRVLACATRPRSGRDSCSAGQTPNAIAVTTASAVLNKQDRHIHLDDRLGGERVGRHPRHDQRKALPRDQHAQRCAGHGDRERLRQQLLHDAAASGSEGRAHGELLLAMRAAHEQQDRHVRAADEQQRRHRAEQQKEPRAHRPRIELDDAAQRHAKRVGVACRRLLRELLHDGLQLGIRFSRRDAWPDLEVGAVVDVGVEPHLERHVDVRFAPAKPRRHHADDLIVLAHELDRAADRLPDRPSSTAARTGSRARRPARDPDPEARRPG